MEAELAPQPAQEPTAEKIMDTFASYLGNEDIAYILEQMTGDTALDRKFATAFVHGWLMRMGEDADGLLVQHGILEPLD